MKSSRLLALSVALMGCTSTSTPGTPSGSDVDSLRTDLERAKRDLAHIETRLTQLEAAPWTERDGEFTQLTIDELRWPTSLGQGDDAREVWAHVVEWKGFQSLKRFTQVADHSVEFVAPGHATVAGSFAEGGVSTDSGSVRFAAIHPHAALEPGVVYQVKPRNQHAGYRWMINEGVTIVGQ